MKRTMSPQALAAALDVAVDERRVTRLHRTAKSRFHASFSAPRKRQVKADPTDRRPADIPGEGGPSA